MSPIDLSPMSGAYPLDGGYSSLLIQVYNGIDVDGIGYQLGSGDDSVRLDCY